jgi:hypothetical protein
MTTGDSQKSGADHRGTQDDPLVVHIKGAEQSQQEATYNQNKDDSENKRKNYELALTGVIALAALAQVGTAVVQACIYRKQSRIMLDSLHAIRRQGLSMRQQTTILSESFAIAKQSAETGLYPIPDFGWPKEAFGFELTDLPSVLPVGIFEGDNFIMGTDRKSSSFVRSDWGDIEKKISSGESHLHFRVRVLYRDIFDDVRTHELQISRVYGVKLQEKPRAPFEVLYGKPAEMVLGTLPDWSDSAYKFGQVEEEQR